MSSNRSAADVPVGASPLSWRGFFFIYLLCVLIWLPLPLGSNRPWAWALMEVLVLGGATIALLVSGIIRHSAANQMQRHPAWGWLFTLWLAYLAFQWLPLGKELLSALSPAAAELYRLAEPVSGERTWSIAIDRGAALGEWLKILSYIVIFYAVIILANTRLRLTVLAGALLAVGFAEAFYAIALYAGGDAIDWWRPHWYGPAVASGTFVNRNHFAAHLVMTFALGTGLLLAVFHSQSHPEDQGASWTSGARRLLSGPALLLVFMLCVMGIALMLSQSRGGLLSLAAGMVLAALATGLKRRSAGYGSALPVALLGMGILAISLWWVGGDALVNRFSRLDSESLTRLGLWRITLDMIADSPWVGFGPGSYATMITAYRGPELGDAPIVRAHNDYLQLIAEQGLIGGLISALAVGLILKHILTAYRRRRDPLARGLLFGALVACPAFLIHGLVDFNFNIPANAAYFFAILGMGVAGGRLAAHPAKTRQPNIG